MSLMVSISGLRGIVGESLIPEVVVKYAAAFAEYCGGGKIVLGRDGRATGKIIANIASSTLLAMGCDVLALGVCPTPTVQLAVDHAGAAGGIAITASHNPIQWNGMKFIGSRGMFLDADEHNRLREIAANQKPTYARWKEIGIYSSDDSFVQKHIEKVLGLQYINVDQIKKRAFKVVVDCINAAGGVIVPELLRRLGCSVVEMNCDVSGIFSHNPEPLPENLHALRARVREENADLGVAVDPDVDRLVLITEKGEDFGEEYTITSVVKFVLGKHAQLSNSKPTVVVNLSTTRAVDDVAKHFGAKIIRTPVGEIYVTKKMKEINALIGGEGSGGVILPEAHYGRDAVVGIALVLQMLAEFGGTLSELKRSLPQYFILKSRIGIDTDNPDAILLGIKNRFESNGTVNTDDGVKIDFSDAWVHLRKSNTEPIIRIIAEATTQLRAENLVKELEKELLKTIS